MIYLPPFLLGLAPSLIWLAFYLRKDSHPEPKLKIVEIFCLGAGITILAIGLEYGLWLLLYRIGLPLFWSQLISIFLLIALIEEYIKYLVVKLRVLADPEFDEPLDLMIYMIVAALGFAALENILYQIAFLLEIPSFEQLQFWESIFRSLPYSFLRFIGATFLHSLSSALFGFFLALSFLKSKNQRLLFLIGLGLAAFFHGLFNLYILEIGESLNSLALFPWARILTWAGFLILVFIQGSLALTISLAFQELKKLKSVCKIE